MTQPNRAQLLARYRAIGTAEAAKVAPAPVSVPTAAHREVVALLDELLGMVPADGAGPFGGMLKTLRRLEPMLLRDFAKVPEDQVVAFLHHLGHRMLAVGGDRGSSAGGDPSADNRQNQSQSA